MVIYRSLNKAIKSAIVITMAVLAMPVSATRAQALPSGLPSDIIFTYHHFSSDPEGVWTELVRLDADSLEVASFHRDKTAHTLQAIGWSPQGDLLAIFREEEGDAGQLCILTPSEARMCFDAPLSKVDPPEPLVTWSDDGRYVYFVTEDDQTYRLVEGDPRTGEAVRTLYEYPVEPEMALPPPWSDDDETIMYKPRVVFAWTTDLRYVAVGVGMGARLRADYGLPVFIVDLQTGQTVDLADAIVANDVDWVCPRFSPQGNFITAVGSYGGSSEDYGSRLVVFDKEALAVHRIDFDDVEPPALSCPTWRRDESAFYFTVFFGLYVYSLRDGQDEELFWHKDKDPFLAIKAAKGQHPLYLSPEETHLAFPVSSLHGGDWYLGVLDLSNPDWDWFEYAGLIDIGITHYMVWMPNKGH